MHESSLSRLTRSIIRVLISLCLAQVSLVVVLIPLARIPIGAAGIFFAISTAYHSLILVIMIRLKELFVFTKKNLPLAKINISNSLSLFRLSSIPTILFLLLLLSDQTINLTWVIIPFLVIVFLSDLLDGYFARKLDQITSIGKYLDSSSDYLVLFSVSFVLLWYGQIKTWFFFLLMIRLAVMTAGNTILFLRYGYVDPKSSFLGKASVFGVMGLFTLIALKLTFTLTSISFAWDADFYAFIDIFLYMVAGVLVVAIFDKLDYLKTTFRQTKKKADSPAK